MADEAPRYVRSRRHQSRRRRSSRRETRRRGSTRDQHRERDRALSRRQKRYEIDSDDYRDATENLERLLSRFAVVPIDRSTAIVAAEIIAGLQDRGESLHDLHDVYIGATARTERLAVLTANVDHFERIDDVQVVDWNVF